MITINRRSLLRNCGLSLSTLTLGSVLHHRAQANPVERRKTSVIFITMGGGPSQFETFDPKPDAPVEYRGTFAPIQTRIPGIQFCELFPGLANLADRIAIIRSIYHEQASHIAEHIVETGFDLKKVADSRVGDMPSIGSVVSRMRGPAPSGIPGYVSIPRHHGYSGPHWVGTQHQFFPIDADPNQENFAVNNLALTEQLNTQRLQERRTLQTAFSGQRAIVDRSGDAAAIDAFSQQAFQLITGEQAQRAFNIRNEDPRVRDRYGRNDWGQRLLLARRLVEAGVPYITVRTFDWDDHDKLAQRMQARCPSFDQGLAALIEDLHDRGMQQDVLVVAMGEFGRTPRVNVNAGRDHYPAVASVLISGGQYKMGQVIGATDRLGAQVTQSPYRPQNFISMVYRHLGIDPATTFNDYAGRPRHILEDRGLITELL